MTTEETKALYRLEFNSTYRSINEVKDNLEEITKDFKDFMNNALRKTPELVAELKRCKNGDEFNAVLNKNKELKSLFKTGYALDDILETVNTNIKLIDENEKEQEDPEEPENPIEMLMNLISKK